MSPTVYLVSGANRGIGLAIVTQLAAQPDVVVFAGARDPTRATELQTLAKANPDRFHVTQLISADKENNIAVMEEIGKVAGQLDVVIANAAIGDAFGSALELRAEEITRHFEINTNGPLILFQAAYQLLKESKEPKFVTVSSVIGSLAYAADIAVNVYPYGASKAAVNWVMRKLHHDFPNFIIFPISPGVVMTDMAARGREEAPGMKELQDGISFVTPQECARGVLEQVEVAKRETHGGMFVDYTGLGKLSW